MADAYKHPVEFAQDELEQAAPDIAWVCHDQIGRELEGLQIEVWPTPSTEEDRAVRLTISDQALVAARLAAWAGDVRTALSEVKSSRRRLSNRIIEATEPDSGQLGRDHIAASVAHALPARVVLETLAAHDLLVKIRRALPDHWREDFTPWVYQFPAHERPDRLGPFYIGNIRLQISETAHLQVGLHDPLAYEADYVDVDPDPDSLIPAQRAGWEEQMAMARQELAGRQEAAARVVLGVLADLNLRLFTLDGKPAGVNDLVDGDHRWLNVDLADAPGATGQGKPRTRWRGQLDLT